MPRGDENQEPQQDVGDHENLVTIDRGWGDPSHHPLCQKISYILSEISVEPSLFLIMLGHGLYNVISQVLILTTWKQDMPKNTNGLIAFCYTTFM